MISPEAKAGIGTLLFFFVLIMFIAFVILFGCFMTQTGCDVAVARPIWCR